MSILPYTTYIFKSKANPNQQKPLKSNNAQGKSKGELGQYLRGRGRNVSPHSPPPKTTDLGGSGGWVAGGGKNRRLGLGLEEGEGEGGVEGGRHVPRM